MFILDIWLLILNVFFHYYFSTLYFLSNRAYGNIVEALYMQDVAPSEQPLYACVVIHEKDVHMVNRLLESKNKVKLSINGKHAWARKYVPKGNKSPQTKSPTTSRAPSPSSRRPSY